MSSSSQRDRGARALAPAKVNLTLEILGKRPDGYHELRTWMLAVALFDEVRATRTDDGTVSLAVSGPAATPDVPSDATNLAWRAAEAVRARAKSSSGVRIELVKRIPSQSGLGGASSDAAATVLATAAALEVELAPAARQELLAALGSDTAFFGAAEHGLALCGGRGETLVEVAPRVPRWTVAIVVPEARCPTAEVYRAVAPTAPGLPGPSATSSLPLAWFDAPASHARQHLFNRLEPAATKVAPELRRWRALFDSIGAEHARLTGSGSAWFALCDDRAEAEVLVARCVEAASRLELRLRGCWVVHPAGHAAKLGES